MIASLQSGYGVCVLMYLAATWLEGGQYLAESVNAWPQRPLNLNGKPPKFKYHHATVTQETRDRMQSRTGFYMKQMDFHEQNTVNTCINEMKVMSMNKASTACGKHIFFVNFFFAFLFILTLQPHEHYSQGQVAARLMPGCSCGCG